MTAACVQAVCKYKLTSYYWASLYQLITRPALTLVALTFTDDVLVRIASRPSLVATFCLWIL